jgi:hypothetical protein
MPIGGRASSPAANLHDHRFTNHSRCLFNVATRFTRPAQHGCVMHIGQAFDKPQALTVAIHIEAALPNLFGICPGTIRFEKLTTTRLALKTLPFLASAILEYVYRLAIRAFYTLHHKVHHYSFSGVGLKETAIAHLSTTDSWASWHLVKIENSNNFRRNIARE